MQIHINSLKEQNKYHKYISKQAGNGWLLFHNGLIKWLVQDNRFILFMVWRTSFATSMEELEIRF